MRTSHFYTIREYFLVTFFNIMTITVLITFAPDLLHGAFETFCLMLFSSNATAYISSILSNSLLQIKTSPHTGAFNFDIHRCPYI